MEELEMTLFNYQGNLMTQQDAIAIAIAKEIFLDNGKKSYYIVMDKEGHSFKINYFQFKKANIPDVTKKSTKEEMISREFDAIPYKFKVLYSKIGEFDEYEKMEKFLEENQRNIIAQKCSIKYKI